MIAPTCDCTILSVPLRPGKLQSFTTATLCSAAVGFAGPSVVKMQGGTRCPQRVETAALPPDICAFGDGIVFGEADPPKGKVNVCLKKSCSL
jgi:hypothetical protein